MQRLDKWYVAGVDWDAWKEDCIAQGEQCFTYDGKDYIVCHELSKDDPLYGKGFDLRNGMPDYTVIDWYVCDALDYATSRKPKRITGTYHSFDDLVSAKMFGDRSIRDCFADFRQFQFSDVIDE